MLSEAILDSIVMLSRVQQHSNHSSLEEMKMMNDLKSHMHKVAMKLAETEKPSEKSKFAQIIAEIQK